MDCVALFFVLCCLSSTAVVFLFFFLFGLQDLAWERYYDLKPSELGDLIRMPKYGKALVGHAGGLGWDEPISMQSDL